MDAPYSFLADLLKEVELPAKGILSRTLRKDEQLRMTLFGFAAGEELSAHTAPHPAVLYFLQGEAQVKLGGDTFDAKAGSLAYMPAHLPHGIYAKTPLVMLLIMVATG
jgi:quercetin dioxygenase-like cupin family protein